MSVSTMPHKRRRRSRADMDRIRTAMMHLARENRPLTVRQLFYLLVTAGEIDKTEAEYKQTVVRLALELRRSGDLPWEWVVDRTRWFFRPATYGSLSDALEATAAAYRRGLWDDAPVAVQVWCESMSVAGIIDSVTDRWDVPLYPGKGYSSHDFLRSAALDIAGCGKPTLIYLFGDYDASGRDIIRFVRETLREYAHEANPRAVIDFEVVAVTEEQISRWNLHGHPAKRTDSRYARYGIDRAVELEAIPPDRLRDLVGACITRHLDPGALARLRIVEDAERETLRKLAEGGAR